MKFKVGQEVIWHSSTIAERYASGDKYKIFDVMENYGIPGRTLCGLKSPNGVTQFAYTDELEVVGPQLSRQEKTQIAIELLDTKLFSVADAIEMLGSLEDSITTPQQAEDKEVREIMRCLDRPEFPTRFEALIHVLVSNGTLTLKQVERALGSDNV